MSESATIPYQRHRLSIADFHRLAEVGILSIQDRVELIEGELIAMAPIGSLHAGTVDYLINAFVAAVGKKALVRAQNPILLGSFSEPQPDITLLKPRDDFYRNSHPGASDILLIIEVSDTTIRFDREYKIPLYARHGIPEVWIVDLESHLLHIHSQQQDGTYLDQKSITTPDDLRPIRLPDCGLDLGELWV